LKWKKKQWIIMKKIGRKLPEVFLPLVRYEASEDKYEVTQPINVFREFRSDALLVGVVGAFVPSVQRKFLREYVKYYREVMALVRVGKIGVVSVNDPFVMRSFAEEIDAGEKVVFVCDFQAEVTKALGCQMEFKELGVRCKPFRCVIRNGEISNWACEDGWNVSSNTRVFRLMREFLGYPDYPGSVYSD
jgi:peroxiredoxin